MPTPSSRILSESPELPELPMLLLLPPLILPGPQLLSLPQLFCLFIREVAGVVEGDEGACDVVELKATLFASFSNS